MTFDDLEHQDRGFFVFLPMSGCETHFKSEVRDRHGQAAYKIFSIGWIAISQLLLGLLTVCGQVNHHQG